MRAAIRWFLHLFAAHRRAKADAAFWCDEYHALAAIRPAMAVTKAPAQPQRPDPALPDFLATKSEADGQTPEKPGMPG